MRFIGTVRGYLLEAKDIPLVANQPRYPLLPATSSRVNKTVLD